MAEAIAGMRMSTHEMCVKPYQLKMTHIVLERGKAIFNILRKLFPHLVFHDAFIHE